MELSLLHKKELLGTYCYIRGLHMESAAKGSIAGGQRVKYQKKTKSDTNNI